MVLPEDTDCYFHDKGLQCCCPEAEFLDEIQTKVLRVFLSTSTTLPWDLYFFKLTQHLKVATVQLTVHCKGERRKTWYNHILLPYGLRNLYRNLWQLSRLCTETSTKLYVYEFGFWSLARSAFSQAKKKHTQTYENIVRSWIVVRYLWENNTHHALQTRDLRHTIHLLVCMLGLMFASGGVEMKTIRMVGPQVNESTPPPPPSNSGTASQWLFL